MPLPEQCSSEPDEVVVECADEAALAGCAKRLAETLPSRAMLAVEGDLGAGKTTFVKHLAAAVGIDPAGVTSPTFTLVHVYEVPGASAATPGPQQLVHMDAYRLTGLDDLATIGWEDIQGGDGWLAVEWPERIAAALPAERLSVQIEITGMTSRTLHLKPTSAALHAAAVAAVSGLTRAPLKRPSP